MSVELPTICQIITILYTNADRRNSDMDRDLLEQAYIKAKKMDRKLREYKLGVSDNTDTEEQWIKELKNSLLAIKRGKYTI